MTLATQVAFCPSSISGQSLGKGANGPLNTSSATATSIGVASSHMRVCLKSCCSVLRCQEPCHPWLHVRGPSPLPFFLIWPLTSTTTRAWGCRWFTSCTMAWMPPDTCSAVCPWLLVPTQTTTICGERGHEEEAAVRVQIHLAPSPLSSPAHLGPDVFQLPIFQPPQYVLCAVATDAKIQGVQRGEELPPDLWGTQMGVIGTGHCPLSSW